MIDGENTTLNSFVISIVSRKIFMGKLYATYITVLCWSSHFDSLQFLPSVILYSRSLVFCDQHKSIYDTSVKESNKCAIICLISSVVRIQRRCGICEQVTLGLIIPSHPKQLASNGIVYFCKDNHVVVYEAHGTHLQKKDTRYKWHHWRMSLHDFSAENNRRF